MTAWNDSHRCMRIMPLSDKGGTSDVSSKHTVSGTGRRDATYTMYNVYLSTAQPSLEEVTKRVAQA